MSYQETYYRVLAKERGAKLSQIRECIELASQLQVDADKILEQVRRIVNDNMED